MKPTVSPAGGFKGSAAQRGAEGLVGIFQNYISPVDGDRCPSYPTCSQYARQAIRKHGALVGVAMTVDRLIHETDEIHRAPLIKVHQSHRYYDPVENNDFWWSRK
ncbi:MAG TPA: membrane protein insertion efficiency factor YidD [Thermodesulfobacteriota bacterium]|nr:membrane protein insertion efficiency factor YidD [Thermodesulfobacteriota bacterium]